MNTPSPASPRCIIIAGPNGAGRLALRRIAPPVKQGGHTVPRDDVIRRFTRGWQNFQTTYRPLADTWAVYDNSGTVPRLLEEGP